MGICPPLYVVFQYLTFANHPSTSSTARLPNMWSHHCWDCPRLPLGDHSTSERSILRRCHARCRSLEFHKSESTTLSHKPGQAEKYFLSRLPCQGWKPCRAGTDGEDQATIGGGALFVGLNSQGKLLYDVIVDMFVEKYVEV